LTKLLCPNSIPRLYFVTDSRFLKIGEQGSRAHEKREMSRGRSIDTKESGMSTGESREERRGESRGKS
jgi:hypothetical protein